MSIIGNILLSCPFEYCVLIVYSEKVKNWINSYSLGWIENGKSVKSLDAQADSVVVVYSKVF